MALAERPAATSRAGGPAPAVPARASAASRRDVTTTVGVTAAGVASARAIETDRPEATNPSRRRSWAGPGSTEQNAYSRQLSPFTPFGCFG
jgi:hypothetical protein